MDYQDNNEKNMKEKLIYILDYLEKSSDNEQRKQELNDVKELVKKQSASKINSNEKENLSE